MIRSNVPSRSLLTWRWSLLTWCWSLLTWRDVSPHEILGTRHMSSHQIWSDQMCHLGLFWHDVDLFWHDVDLFWHDVISSLMKEILGTRHMWYHTAPHLCCHTTHHLCCHTTHHLCYHITHHLWCDARKHILLWLYVSFTKEPYKREYVLKKRPILFPRPVVWHETSPLGMGWLWLVGSLKL